MKILVRKMSKLGLLRFKLIADMIILAAAILVPPIALFVADATLMANPYVLGVVVVAMLLFGLVGYFSSIRPYVLYHKLPEVLAQTDGEFLYIYGEKEAKIPLSALTDVFMHVDLPYMFQKELLGELLIHLFSEKYGSIDIEVPEYGKYRLRFVANVEETAQALAQLWN